LDQANQETKGNIISENVQDVMKQKMKVLVEMYKNNAY
jgi:hypothetical protein